MIFGVLGVITISGFTIPIDVVSIGTGIVSADDKEVAIRSPGSGFISQLSVKNGQMVNDGSVLFSYEDINSKNLIESRGKSLELLRLRLVRKETEYNQLNNLYSNLVDGECVSDIDGSHWLRDKCSAYLSRKKINLSKIDSYADEIIKIDESIRINERKLELTKRAKGSQFDILNIQEAINEHKVRKSSLLNMKLEGEEEIEEGLLSLSSDVLKEINVLTNEIDSIKSEIIKTEFEKKNAEDKVVTNFVRAPYDSVILNLEHNFSTSSYVKEGDLIMNIKKIGSKSMISAKFASKYRPYLKIGDAVKVVFDLSSDRTTTTGFIKSISVDSFKDEDRPDSGLRFYEVSIEFEEVGVSMGLIGVNVNLYAINNRSTLFSYILDLINPNLVLKI